MWQGKYFQEKIKGLNSRISSKAKQRFPSKGGEFSHQRTVLMVLGDRNNPGAVSAERSEAGRSRMVPAAGFEPTTPWFEARCSIQAELHGQAGGSIGGLERERRRIFDVCAQVHLLGSLSDDGVLIARVLLFLCQGDTHRFSFSE